MSDNTIAHGPAPFQQAQGARTAAPGAPAGPPREPSPHPHRGQTVNLTI